MTNASQATEAPNEFQSQPDDVITTSLDEREKLIISMRRIDGFPKIISIYEDDVWWLTGSPASTSKSVCKIDFSAVPSPLRDVTKAIIYRYLRRGVRNARRPQAATASATFTDISYFLNFVHSLGISKLRDISPMTCSAYVQFARTKLCSLGGKNRAIDPSNRTVATTTLYKRFAAVEKVFELSHYTQDAMSQHPWIDSSADVLAGGGNSSGAGLTPLIPDDVFTKIFQHAFEIVQDGPRLLDLRDNLERFDLKTEVTSSYLTTLKTKYLREAG
ncbi:hypothetical protein [Janthinobacterium sp. UMAB-60]|uniref:hypothetical protein n=1 Tax=Janthinobacterium sp. UMAB-60 TaxID=1365365 RepID=UPI001C565E6D|nr:hypothetical protein [Janthinobacterium sp. UMAB-60]